MSDFRPMVFGICLPHWAKEAILAAFVGALFGEVHHMIVTLIEHFQTATDNKVLDFLALKSPGENTTVADIHRELRLRTKRIEASLHRLRNKHLAEINGMGYWHRIVRTKEN
jgi:hypothetical protein